MKMNNIKKAASRLTAVLAVAALSVSALTGCGSSGTANAASGPRQIKVAVAPGFFPITYADDDGVAQGYDVEVFKAVDELLEDYTFTYEIADKETMNVGVQAGTYQAGINSLFKTEARTETYYMPENNMGYTPVGIIQRTDSNVTSLAQAYDEGLSVAPTSAAGGIRFVLGDWNEANPDKAFDFELNTEFSYANLFASIQSGEYDFSVDLIPVFNLQKPETVEGLHITDPIDVVPTYPIVNKGEAELGDKINEALATLKENGTLSKLSEEAFGYDVFAIAH
ncbi:transporter substrate-binding domain-containing protein [Butyrivibrio sp. FCS014]|uniref:transporter substrate-binding domain-containing protein n=1 Tax=Butyrivibrio sp. FCS014 TaxID=1408304 RepID=UPI000463CE64|nr:transporter substrate-binding domain-containing protein [Butyrivibrio sp. FCS014]